MFNFYRQGEWSTTRQIPSAEKSFVLLAFTLGTVSQRSVNRHQGPHRLNQSLNLNLLDCSDDQASKMSDGEILSKDRQSLASLPIAGWLYHYQKDWFRPDLIAGLTAAAVVIPKAMAYATIAGLPVQVGSTQS